MNSKEHKFQVEEINKIKYKLNKYAELKNDVKVKEYVEHLRLFKITIEILKETDIVNCLRALRAKQNSAYSSSAADLIAAWKAKCNTEESNGAGAQVKKPAAPVLNGHKASGQPVVKNGHSVAVAVAMNAKKRSITDLESARGAKNGDASSKPSATAAAVDLGDASKRQRLSYSDYKSSRTSETTREDAASYQRTDFGSIDEYGDDNDIEDEVNSSTFLNDIPKKSTAKTKEHDRYSPQPNLLNNNNESNKYDNDNNAKLMKAPPVPLQPLSSILPIMPTSIKPQYSSNPQPTTTTQRPAPLSMSEYAINAANDEEFLDKVFKSRNSKKTLYVGKKKTDGPSTVPKLYDLCIQSLKASIDDLPTRLYAYNLNSDFPVPFDLIKPVLEKANAKQLEIIESYSSNLMEDSDLLWKKLCESEFKKVNPPDEDETWRELYFKQVDKREEEFKRVRQIISSKQAVKPKERQTQLATMKPNTIKTVNHYSSNGGSSSLKGSNSSSSMRPLGAAAGPRIIEARKRPGFGAPQPTQKSQGMKDTMKLLKKFRR